MNAFEELKTNWLDKDPKSINQYDAEKIKSLLENVAREDLKTVDDHKSFLMILQLYRLSCDWDKFKGANYKQQMKSLLAQGEDGLYSDNLRFLYELIQNVDDCEYEDLTNCHLSIGFEVSNGCITFTYNEVGFTPENVFSITGIGEASKNVADGKIAIGEKGIGFKAVFGVADAVLIQSGMFSFQLSGDEIQLPIPVYDNYKPVSGTKITLFMDEQRVHDCYEMLYKRYSNTESILSNNPIMFLNHLTRLYIFRDFYHMMDFETKKKTKLESITLSKDIDLFDYEVTVKINNGDSPAQNVTRCLQCWRFEKWVCYDRGMIQSRYGKDTELKDTREMLVAVIFPKVECLMEIARKGLLYSFLPTQVRLNLPAFCHVPYKLNSSREYVDPYPRFETSQNYSAWFLKSCDELCSLLQDSLFELSRIYQQKVVLYLPPRSDGFYVDATNEKVNCLRHDYLSTDSLYDQCLLFCSDGNYHKIDDCTVIDHPKAEEAFSLLYTADYLFLPPDGCHPGELKKRLNIRVVEDITRRLFRQALIDKKNQYESLAFVEKDENNDSVLSPDYLKKIWLTLSAEDVHLLNGFKKIWSAVKEEGIKSHETASASLHLTVKGLSESIFDGGFLPDDANSDDLDTRTRKILDKVNLDYMIADLPSDEFLVAHNAVILSDKNPFDSFCSLCARLDPKGKFSQRMINRSSYIELNAMTEGKKEVSDLEYLKCLRENRRSVKVLLGENGYRNYAFLIQQTHIDSSRFIFELLQNADDLKFPQGVVPTFKIVETSDGLCSSCNEKGFSRSDVRSITSIADSTKKKIENDKLRDVTGEKGIGFKSVFSVFSTVDIDSGDFHFSLSKDEPTIPVIRTNCSFASETEMHFCKDTDEAPISLPDQDALLHHCLALKHLKKVVVGDHEVTILDRDGQRIITIDGKEHVFDRIEHSFIVDDITLRERESVLSDIHIDRKQTLILYVPQKSSGEWYLYNCLPTMIKMEVPLAVDAPYMLDTSRDWILQSKWNTVVTMEVYKAIISLMEAKAQIIGIDALQYLKFNNGDATFCKDQMEKPSMKFADLKSYLKNALIIPTKQPGQIVPASTPDLVCLPAVLLSFVESGGSVDYELSQIVDNRGLKKYKSALEYLDLAFVSDEDACDILLDHLTSSILDNQIFREELYSWLEETKTDDIFNPLKDLPIIPVLPCTENDTRYVSLSESHDNLYVLNDATESGDDYWILDENVLPNDRFYSIFERTCKEMTDEVRRERYITYLSYIVNDHSKFFDCYLNNKDNWNRWRERILPSFSGKYPSYARVQFLMRNRCFSSFAFCCLDSRIKGPFADHYAVNSVWNDFAFYFERYDLSNIDIPENGSFYHEMLTDEDMASICGTDYFVNRDSLIRYFIRCSLIPEELIDKYDLRFIAEEIAEEIEENMQETSLHFPQGLDDNRVQFMPVDSILENPAVVTESIANRKIFEVKNEDSSVITIPDEAVDDSFTENIVNHLLDVYTPKGRDKCYCQMCGNLFYPEYLSGTAIVYVAGEYIPQLYMILCNRCKRKLDMQKQMSDYCRILYDSFMFGATEIDNAYIVQLGNTHLESMGLIDAHYQAIRQIIEARWSKLSLSYSEEDCQHFEKPGSQFTVKGLMAEPGQTVMSPDAEPDLTELEQIAGYLRYRGVTELVHFTPVENLESIFAYGLVPRNQADELGCMYTDDERLDHHTDTVSLSITTPNEWMRKDKAAKGFSLVALYIDIAALFSVPLECVGYYPMNAALSIYNSRSLLTYTGLDSVKEMFADTVSGGNHGEQDRDGKPFNCPTDTQAEVLFRGTIPVSYIKRISAQGIGLSQTVIDECRRQNIVIC